MSKKILFGVLFALNLYAVGNCNMQVNNRYPATAPADSDPPPAQNSTPMPTQTTCTKEYQFDGKHFHLSDKEWKERLTHEQYQVLREKEKEPAYNNAYYNFSEPGIYHCAGCDLPLFSSTSKYDANTGWPTFSQPICKQNVTQSLTWNVLSTARNVSCARCDGRLGQVYHDGPEPTHKRYQIFSAALKFKEL